MPGAEQVDTVFQLGCLLGGQRGELEFRQVVGNVETCLGGRRIFGRVIGSRNSGGHFHVF